MVPAFIEFLSSCFTGVEYMYTYWQISGMINFHYIIIASRPIKPLACIIFIYYTEMIDIGGFIAIHLIVLYMP